jgi:hypothetical protein
MASPEGLRLAPWFGATATRQTRRSRRQVGQAASRHSFARGQAEASENLFVARLLITSPASFIGFNRMPQVALENSV